MTFRKFLLGFVGFFLMMYTDLSGQVSNEEFVIKRINKEEIIQQEATPFLVDIKQEWLKSYLIGNRDTELRRVGLNRFVIKGWGKINPDHVSQAYSLSNQWKWNGNMRPELGKEQILTLLVTSHDIKKTITNLQKIKNIEIVGQHEPAGILVIKAANKAVERVLGMNEISSVEIRMDGPQAESNVLTHDLSTNRINWVHYNRPALNGMGQTVSVKERGMDQSDIDLSKRITITGLEDELVSSHTTAMATIVAGAGNSSELSLGVAHRSTITSSSFSRILPDPDSYFEEFDIRVQNHSYGFEVNNVYTGEARAYDVQSNQNPEILHVFSAGNLGATTPEFGAYLGLTGWANLSGGLKMAKNIIAVGAIDELGELDFRSSRGPTYDGRIRPEIVAYGKGGTSEAAALVSGTSVILSQAFQEMRGFRPTSALIKSILISSAEDVGDPGIDFKTGYGNLNAKRAIEVVESGQMFSGSIMQGEINTHQIEIPENTKELRLALVWNDPAANTGDDISLTNNIDASIVLPGSGEVMHPWVLDSRPDVLLLTAPAVRKRDDLNNVELITIDQPLTGTYSVKVFGDRVSTEDQTYQIAYYISLNDEFTWTYPTAGDAIESGSEIIPKWQNTFEGTGQVYTSINDGEWQLEYQVDFSSMIDWSWTAPDKVSTVRFRMEVDGNEFISDKFTISPRVSVNVGFSCSEEVLLYWSPIPGINEYDLYTLNQEGNLDLIENTADTFFIVSQDRLFDSFFAINPTVDGSKGVRGFGFRVNESGVNCYYNYFNAAVDNEQVSLNLSLSTSYNVEAVFFERQADRSDEFHVLGEYNSINDFELNWLDSRDRSGYYVYRARILLKNGEMILTPEIELPVILESSTSIFPNPASSSEDLNVLFGDPTVEFLSIVDISGTEVLSYALNDQADSFTLSGLKSGVYIFRFLSNEGVVSSKRVIVY